MAVSIDIVSLCCNALCALVVLCGAKAFLDGIFDVWAAAKGTKRGGQSKNKTGKTYFSGTGQTLRQATVADRVAAIQTRIQHSHVAAQFSQARATMKKRQTKLKKAQELSLARPSSSSPPPSPRSVLLEPVTPLPKELTFESTKHFFMKDATKFIAVPNTVMGDSSDDAVVILRRLCSEFMPIIRQRNFCIRSVSEMCCCADGLEYEMGGEKRSVKAGETIVGNDHDTVAGYNGKLVSRFGGRAEYVIHVRLRVPGNHAKFMKYNDIVDTMAHELSHCVHEDHGPEFWNLMEDILNDRAKIVEDLKNGVVSESNPVEVSKEQYGDFDIYNSATGQMRNWNGHVMVRAE